LYALENDAEITIKETIDMELVKSIVGQQKNLQKYNMATTKNKRYNIKRVLLIYDDVLGDAQLKSYQSDLASFTTVSRHSKITNIFLV
jgi:hypothetical protein